MGLVPAMFYGAAVYVAVMWDMPPPLLLGLYSVRLLTRLQRGPREAPITPVGCCESRSYGQGRYWMQFLNTYL